MSIEIFTTDRLGNGPEIPRATKLLQRMLDLGREGLSGRAVLFNFDDPQPRKRHDETMLYLSFGELLMQETEMVAPLGGERLRAVCGDGVGGLTTETEYAVAKVGGDALVAVTTRLKTPRGRGDGMIRSVLLTPYHLNGPDTLEVESYSGGTVFDRLLLAADIQAPV